MTDQTDTTLGYHEADPWKDLPRWECDHCPFDSLDEDLVADHVAKVHTAEQAVTTSMILGPDGRHLEVPADSPEAVFETLVALHTLDLGDLQGLTKPQLAELAERRALDVGSKATVDELTAALIDQPTTDANQET